MRYRGERRRVTKNIIKKRKKKLLGEVIHSIYFCLRGDPFENGDIYEGELKNNNVMNAWGGGGTRKKTNTRKSCAAYRHHGSFGPANNYMSHDKKQLVDGEQQIKEFINSIGE